MAAVAGLRGTGNWGTDERPKNFREYILWREPNGSAPLLALTAKMGSSSTDDPEFSWWDEPTDIWRGQINGALTNVATTFVIDSTDPDATDPGAVWATAEHLKAGDILMVEEGAETAAHDYELVIVTSVASATTFDVTRGYAGTTNVAITDDTFLTKVGSAYEEGSAAPTAASRNPIKYSNYTQIFKDIFSLTNTAKETHARTGDVMSNDKRRKASDHAMAIEMAMMFGVSSESTGAGGNPERTMAGLRKQISTATTTIFGAAITTTTFENAVYKVFDYVSPAGDDRIAFCGNGALNALNQLVAATGTINFGSVVEVYGMKLREYILPQGRLMLRTHPLMNRHGRYSNSMFLIDPSSVTYKYLRNRDTKSESFGGLGVDGVDSTKGQWITECSLMVDRGGLTCGYLGNVTYP